MNRKCFSKNRCGQKFLPSHLSASILRSVPARIMTCQCLRSVLCHLSRHLVSGYIVFHQSCHLSFGLPRFRFPFTVFSSTISFLVASPLARLCTCPNHLNLFSLRNSAIEYMCASHDIVSSFLFPTAACAFQLCAISSPPSF